MSKLQFPWIAIVALALLLATGMQAQPTEPGYIRLARVTGTVTVEDKATREQSAAREVPEIAQGTIVRTAADSSVILVFSNGSTVSLGADSVLDVEEFLQDPFGGDLRPSEMTAEPTVSRTKLNLSQGELVGNVKTLRQDAGSSFTVRTPAGAAGIRGTTFRIVYRPDGTGQAFFSLTTLEGEVGFSTVTGTIDAPQALVMDNQEVVIEISVDDQTGEVTVLTPAADISSRTASTAEIATIAEAVQQVAESVVSVVLTPKTPAGTSGPSTGPTPNDDQSNDRNSEATSPQADPLPPVLNQPNPDLTPGDGRR